MKSKKIFLVSILAIIYFGCTSPQEKNIRSLKVNFSSDVLDVSNEFNKVEFIPIETNDKNIVRKISKIVNKDSIYILYSASPDNCVSMHDKLGRFCCSIRKMGKGPGEFIFSYAMHVDSLIHVYDRAKNTIQSYDLSGHHISDYKGVGYLSKFLFNGNFLVLYDHSDGASKFHDISLDHKLNVFDITDKDYPKLIFSDIERQPHREKYLRVVLPNNFFYDNNNLYYWTYPAESICNLNMETLMTESYVKIDLGKNKITKEFLDKSWRDVVDFSMAASKKNLFALENFYALKRDVYSFENRKRYIGIDSKQNENLICYNKIQLFPLESVPPINLKYKIRLVGSMGSDQIIFSWDAIDFIDYCKIAKDNVAPEDWNMILSSYPGLKRTIDETTEESNPVLMIATLK